MSTIRRRLEIKDCGSSWCDLDVGCRGHVITAEFSNVSDTGLLYIDGKYAFGGGDTLMTAVADIVNDMWSDNPKYFVTKEELEAPSPSANDDGREG